MIKPDEISQSSLETVNSKQEVFGSDYDDTLNLDGKLNLGEFACLLYWFSLNKDLVIITKRKPDTCLNFMTIAVENKIPIERLTLKYFVNLLNEVIKRMGSTSSIIIDTYYDLLDPNYGYTMVSENEDKIVSIYNELRTSYPGMEGDALITELHSHSKYTDFKSKISQKINKFYKDNTAYDEKNKDKKFQLQNISGIFLDDTKENVSSARALKINGIHYDKNDLQFKWLEELAKATGLFDKASDILLGIQSDPSSYINLACVIYSHYIEQYCSDFLLKIKSNIYKALIENKLFDPFVSELILEEIDLWKNDRSLADVWESSTKFYHRSANIKLAHIVKSKNMPLIRQISKDWTMKDKRNNEAPLHALIREGNDQAFAALVSKNEIKIEDCLDQNDETLLHALLQNIEKYKDEAIFNFIIEKNVPINKLNLMGNSALYYYSEEFDIKKSELYQTVIIKLVEKGANLLAKNGSKQNFFETVFKQIEKIKRHTISNSIINNTYKDNDDDVKLNQIYIYCGILSAIKNKMQLNFVKNDFKKLQDDNPDFLYRTTCNCLPDSAESNFYLEKIISILDVDKINNIELISRLTKSSVLKSKDIIKLNWSAMKTLKNMDKMTELQQRYFKELSTKTPLLVIDFYGGLMIKEDVQDEGVSVSRWRINYALIPGLLYSQYAKFLLIANTQDYDLEKSVTLISNLHRDYETLMYGLNEYKKLGITFIVISKYSFLYGSNYVEKILLPFEKENLGVAYRVDHLVLNSNKEFEPDDLVTVNSKQEEIKKAIENHQLYKVRLGEAEKKVNSLLGKNNRDDFEKNFRLLQIKEIFKSFFFGSMTYIVSKKQTIDELAEKISEANLPIDPMILPIEKNIIELIFPQLTNKKFLKNAMKEPKLNQIHLPIMLYWNTRQDCINDKEIDFNILKQKLYEAINNNEIKLSDGLKDLIAEQFSLKFSWIDKIGYFWRNFKNKEEANSLEASNSNNVFQN